MLTHGSHVKVTQNQARETKDSTHGISDPSDRPADEVRAHPSYGSEIRVSGSLSDLPGVYPTPGLRRRSVAELEPSIWPRCVLRRREHGPLGQTRQKPPLPWPRCPGQLFSPRRASPPGHDLVPHHRQLDGTVRGWDIPREMSFPPGSPQTHLSSGFSAGGGRARR
uniref:Uncharacterized protein n=1 Tax=Rousettus aegyptiacus TaxID=9407 RepID=A0A7J8C2R3_ROUAE|nr:hypothetical protein HJG63_009430 [Rousettus aegyptiacus]